jgi:DNA repair exonuclease SbcCD nuclease subunit
VRLLLLADTQIGSGLDLGDGEHGPGSRLNDQLDGLARVTQIARDENVDAVAHLGDVFERPTPPPWQVIGVRDWLRELALPTLFVLGNHDLKSPALPHVLGIFDGQVQVFDKPGVAELAGAKVAVLPWAPMSRLAAGESLPRPELKRRTVEALILFAAALREEAGDGGILLGHWAVSGSSLPSGAAIEEFMDEPIVPWVDIDQLGFRLAAFGHIHAPQVIAAGQASTPMIYTGSPIACNFGEAGTPHGVWLWDDAGDGELRFVPVDDRRFVTIDADPSAGADIDALLAEAGGVDGAFVRFRYTASDRTVVDEAAVRKVLADAGARRVFVKRRPAEQVARARVVIEDESIDPTAALELWLEHNNVNGDADAIRQEHARLLEGL